MGNTWTVREWRLLPSGSYGYIAIYRGQSVLRAIRIMVKAKLRGTGCATLEWR